MKKTIVLIIILVCNLSVLSFASNVPDLKIRSIRQMGMGGVGVATAKGQAALYLNPASLSRIKEEKLTLPSGRFAISKELLSSLEKFEQIKSADNESKELEILSGMVPESLMLDFGFDPIIAFASKDFGIGLYCGGLVDGGLYDPLQPVMKLSAFLDVAPIIGYSSEIELGGKAFSVGIAGKYINRVRLYDKQTGSETFSLNDAEIIESINLSKLIERFEEDTNYMVMGGIGVDLGILTTVETGLGKGDIGFALHNIGATLSGKKDIFDNNNNITDSESIARTIPVSGVLGVALDTSLPESWGSVSEMIGDFTLACDYKIISPHSSWNKNLFMGIEKSLCEGALNLRGGINHGYLVGGIGVDFAFVNFEYAYFAEEMSSEISNKTRYYHVFQLGFLL
jgi:hypothetical protein